MRNLRNDKLRSDRIGTADDTKTGAFAEVGREYWYNGYSPIPLSGKIPLVKSWQSYGPNRPQRDRFEGWLSDFPTANIGIVLGGMITDSHRLAVIDVDDDRFVRLVRAILGEDMIAKRGKKGASFFVRADKELASGKLSSPTFGHVGDFLSLKTQTVLPPSIHPDTGDVYEWLGDPLLEVDRADLPVFTMQQMGLLRAIIESEFSADILVGDATHDSALRLSSQCVRFGTDECVVAAISAMFQEGYEGNTLSELPGMVADARKKGFDKIGADSLYDPGHIGPHPLGYTEQNTYVFHLPRRRQVVAMSPQQLTTPAGLLGIEEQQFWAERFPKFGKDGTPTGTFNPQWAADALMTACRKNGPFSMTKVRGRGVWYEGERLVVNLTGDPITGTNNIYVCFDPVDFAETEQNIDVERILSAFRMPNWKNSDDAILLLGWSFLAPICGALNWRPHVFIHGSRNTGKSTLLNGLTGLLSPLVISLDGQSTEAGIRQRIGPDSLPVILDEFESDGNHGRLRSVIKLARSASSGEGTVARGTPEGKALQFSIRTTFLFAAITPMITAAADATRIVQLELNRHDNDPDVGRTFNAAMREVGELGTAWCRYAISLAGVVSQAVDTFKDAMPSADSRHNLNMATLFAGAFVALRGEAPASDDAEHWVNQHLELIVAHAEPHRGDDTEDCLNHLLGSMIEDQTVGHLLEKAKATGTGHNSQEQNQLLCNWGIRWVDEGFVVANKHPGLDRIFTGTRWEGGGWTVALRRVEGNVAKEAIRFSGLRSRGTWLPGALIEDAEIIQTPRY